jgi:adenylate cyclase
MALHIHERSQNERYLRELRLFIEEICCNLCRFCHADKGGVAHEDIRITQESYLGVEGVFADIRIQVKDCAPYFIEVKYGYSRAQIVSPLTRKYGPKTDLGGATRVMVVLHPEGAAMWSGIVSDVQARLQSGLQLEIWEETKLFTMLRELFGVKADSFSEEHVLGMRTAINQAKGKYAFQETWADEEVQNALIWHFGFWRLKQLREIGDLGARAIMPPGLYPDVAVVMADLCSFSSYVRDTREEDVIRHCLSTFYSKARYEILNTGGMMYQFVGDEVIGLYGLPDRRDGYLESAFQCAKSLIDIGSSVSHEWQRQIDRIQNARGVHIGVALGDMQLVSLRPFSRAHLGGIGEVINLSARLLAHAGPGEIVASNTYYQALSPSYQASFQECEPIEAKNMGTIQAWKMT